MTAVLIAWGNLGIILGLGLDPASFSSEWWALMIGVGLLSYVAGRLVDAVVKTSLRGPQ